MSTRLCVSAAVPIFHTCIHISWIYTLTLCMHRRILTVIVYSERCGSVSSLFTPLRTSVHFRKREKSSSFGFVCARRSCCLFRGPTWLALSYRVHWETGSWCKEAWWECMRWTAIIWPQFLSEIDWIRSNTLCTRLHKSVESEITASTPQHSMHVELILRCLYLPVRTGYCIAQN